MVCIKREGKKCIYSLDRVNDLSEVRPVIESAFPHMKHQFPLWFAYISQNGESYVLRNGNKPTGFLHIERENDIGKINFVAIHPSEQRKGLGSKLLSFAESRIGKGELSLHAEGVKMENLMFYTKNGWKIHKIDPKGYEHSSAVEFRKRIPDTHRDRSRN